MFLTSSFKLVRTVAVVFAVASMSFVFAPAHAFAQSSAASTSPQSSTTAPPVVVRWNNGLSVESADGDTKIQFGTLMQADGRFALNTPSPITDTFLLRRARLIVQGRLSKSFEFYFVPDFSNSALTLFDAYVDTKFSNAFRIRAGKSKAPVGLEQLYSDATLAFAERSVGNNLMPNRDVGVTALGDLFKGHLSYVGGVENGVPDAANGDTDTNGGKDLVGRATVKAGPVAIAVGASHGQQTGALPSFKSTAQQTFFSYGTGVVASGSRNRVSPAVSIYYKAFGAFAEYFRSSQVVAKSTTSSAIANTGWNATGIFVLTGEAASERGATPKAPFDPANKHWGALQLAVRVSSLTVDPRAFNLGLTAAGVSRTAKSAGIGVVWYNTSNVKHILMFERTVFDGNSQGTRKAENALIFRVQVSLAPRL